MFTKWAWQTQVTDNAATNVEDPSLQRNYRADRGGKVYLWVKNSRGSNMLLGDVVYFITTDFTQLTVGYLGDSNTAVDGMAGVVTSTQGIVAAQYGWVQVFGPNATINTNGLAAANEVQTLTPTTNASAGFFSVRCPNVTGQGVTGPLAFSSSTATIQTALDLASGVANGIVVTAAGNPLATAVALTFTFSGTGFASLPWTETVKIETAALTGTTKVLTVRTTKGTAAGAVGDYLLGVSGQSYVSSVAPAASAAPAPRHIISQVAYGTATPAMKQGFIRCL